MTLGEKVLLVRIAICAFERSLWHTHPFNSAVTERNISNVDAGHSNYQGRNSLDVMVGVEGLIEVG